MPGRLDGLEATIRDLSLTGARIEIPVPAAIAEHAQLIVEVAGGVPLDFTGSSRSSWTDRDGRTMVGFEFDAGQYRARARLALALFGAAEPLDKVTFEAETVETRRKRAARAATPAKVGKPGKPTKVSNAA